MPHVPSALREKIQNLINEYANALDDEEIDRWPQFFTESALYHVTTKENHTPGFRSA